MLVLVMVAELRCNVLVMMSMFSVVTTVGCPGICCSGRDSWRCQWNTARVHWDTAECCCVIGSRDFPRA